MVSALNSRLRNPDLSPSQGCRVLLMDKALTALLRKIKWSTGDNPAFRLASHPGRGRNTPSHENQIFSGALI